jgi:hypothetical protein
MEKFNEMEEELTDAMHATFWVTEEEDREHRVWAALRIVNAPGSTYSIEEAISLVQVTMVDYEKYKDSWPLPG